MASPNPPDSTIGKVSTMSPNGVSHVPRLYKGTKGEGASRRRGEEVQHDLLTSELPVRRLS